MLEPIRRLQHDEGGACNKVLGLQQPVYGRFGHVVAVHIGVFDRQFPGRQRRLGQGQIDDRRGPLRRDPVPRPLRSRRAIRQRHHAALGIAPLPTVKRGSGNANGRQRASHRQTGAFHQFNDLELLRGRVPHIPAAHPRARFF